MYKSLESGAQKTEVPDRNQWRAQQKQPRPEAGWSTVAGRGERGV